MLARLGVSTARRGASSEALAFWRDPTRCKSRNYRIRFPTPTYVNQYFGSVMCAELDDTCESVPGLLPGQVKAALHSHPMIGSAPASARQRYCRRNAGASIQQAR